MSSTIDWLKAKGDTLVAHINDERERLGKWYDPDGLAELSMMADALGVKFHRAAADAMAAAEAERAVQAGPVAPVNRVWPHAEELAAEVANGEHRDDDYEDAP